MKARIRVISGGYFDFIAPRASIFTLEDIAHGLSRAPRFTGHLREPYSVAQHAVLVSYLVPQEHALQALHHDDAEFVMGDMASPLKQLLPAYKAIEAIVHAEVFYRLGLPPKLHESIKRADGVMCLSEQQCLGPEPVELDEGLLVQGLEPSIQIGMVWTAAAARGCFLDRHRELGGGPLLFGTGNIEAIFAGDQEALDMAGRGA